MKTTDNQSEEFIVVDRNDTILGYKTRYECHHDKSLIHRTVGVLIYNSGGQLLLQKRSMTKDMDPGVWGISTAGHIEKGQSYEEAAHRELMEELGVDVALVPVAKFISETREETEMAMLYRGISDGPFKMNLNETLETNFFEIQALRMMVQSKTIQITKGSLQSMKEAGIL